MTNSLHKILSIVLLLVCPIGLGCGPAQTCNPSGRNEVHGSATPTGWNPRYASCGVLSFFGSIDNTQANILLSIDCSKTAGGDDSFDIRLPDPRSLSEASTAEVDITSGNGNTHVTAPSNATFHILESQGTKADLPAAVTNDFVRHFVAHVGTDLSVDVVIRAQDLQKAELSCSP